MTASDSEGKAPLWLAIEEQILKLDSTGLAAGNLEGPIQQIAGELDKAGYNVSRHGGNMILLRFAMKDAKKVGRPLLKDFNAAIAALTLEEAADLYTAVNKLVSNIAQTWPEMNKAERRDVIIGVVEQTRLDLLIAKAKALPDDQGIRLLLAEKVDSQVITAAMEITDEMLQQVKDLIKKELDERERVAKLLEAVAGKSDIEKVKHLFTNDVAEALILEMAKVDQSAIDAAKQAMEAEQKEKQRLAAEEAARKKKEAEGPSLEDISAEDMAAFIYSIREIMEFSEVEKEIRSMCEQSSIPKALVEIAVTDPAKLDEMEKQAQG